MRILLDTSVLLAFYLDSDVSHARAKKFFASIAKQRPQLIVTDYVLDEFFTRILYDYGEKLAKTATQAVLSQIRLGTLTFRMLERENFLLTCEEFIKLAPKGLSFTDATLVVMYSSESIDELCTLDSDFRKVKVKLSKI